MAKILSMNRLRKSPMRSLSEADKLQRISQVEQDILKILQNPKSSNELSIINIVKEPKISEEHPVSNAATDPKPASVDKHIEVKKESKDKEVKSKKIDCEVSSNIIPPVSDSNETWTCSNFYNAISHVLTNEPIESTNTYNLKWHNKSALNLVYEITDLLKETYESIGDDKREIINTSHKFY